MINNNRQPNRTAQPQPVTQPQGVAQPQGVVQPNQQQPGGFGTVRDTISLTGMRSSSRIFGSPISTSTGSDYLIKFKKALEEIYETADRSFTIELISLDKAQITALNFSALLVCVRNTSTPNNLVTVHTLLLEATGAKLTQYTKNFMGRQITIDRVPGDAFNKFLIAFITSAIERAYPGVPQRLVDACVIPREIDLEDKKVIHAIARNAGIACGNELEICDPSFVDFSLNNARGYTNLLVELTTSEDHVLNVVNQPVRSDGIIELKEQAQGSIDSAELNVGATSNIISRLTVFPDLIYSPVTTNNQNAWNQQQIRQHTASYASRLVITGIENSRAYTSPLVLLALLTALSLRDDNNWYQFYRPRSVMPKDVNIYDIGVLNIECNLTNDPEGGRRIDTQAADFSLSDLGSLIQAMFWPGLVISLDVARNGPDTWFTSVYDVADSNDPESTKAQEAIYNAANTLTNGAFGRYFAPGKAMFTDTGNIVHAGHYTDRMGRLRDIRDYGYLAIANIFGERNPNVVNEYSDTFARTDIPLEQRLKDRWEIIKTASGELAILTGYYHRVTFTLEFLDSLLRGAVDSGLVVRVTTPMQGSEFTNRRGNAQSWLQQALIGSGQSPFQRGYGSAPVYAQGYNHTNFRTF